MKKLSEEEYGMLQKEAAEEERLFPTFPKSRWKTVLWWVISVAGVVCWVLYKMG